ncbi:MAG: flagellar biosynthetic protein FliO [Rhodocyclaceae bacterium]|nr:flagellar biosynthetic protein FliO [Rhodocyclaceae bacterium]
MRPPLFLLSVLSASAHAEASASTATSSDISGSLLQLMLGFGVVLALLFAALWLLKRISAPQGFSARLLRVVGSTPVGPRERVVVVEIGERWLVLGVAPGRISSLHDLPRQETPPATTDGDFASRIRRALERRNAP